MLETPGVRSRPHWDRPDLRGQFWQEYRDGARKLGRAWEGCHNCLPHERDPGEITEVHHVIRQQDLKAIARDRKWPTLRLLRVLTDPRNSMIACPRCHHGDTGRMKPIYRESIRPYVWEFIDELGLRQIAFERYPPRPS